MSAEAEKAANWDTFEEYRKTQKHLEALRSQARKWSETAGHLKQKLLWVASPDTPPSTDGRPVVSSPVLGTKPAPSVSESDFTGLPTQSEWAAYCQDLQITNSKLLSLEKQCRTLGVIE